ncbi:hypothetical protein [Bacillus sp. AFS015802]|nr:hypothetical protein [Bacillus sp. AFS015802]
MAGFTIYASSVQGIIAGVFAIVGFLGVTYLALNIETQKRNKDK